MSSMQNTQSESRYVSITGLRFKKPWNLIPFLRYAIPSKMQADNAKGNICTLVFTNNGTRHTLTVWESKKHMLDFAYSGIHKKAIGIFRNFFSGKTYGYTTDKIPDQEEAIEILNREGKEY